MNIAYFDMLSGVSGDMILGALVDCGLPEKVLTDTVAALGLEGVEVRVSRVESKGIGASRVEVLCSEGHHHRGLGVISGMIGRSGLDRRVKDLSLRIFTRLAGAEAKVHGVEVEKIHFHEVGALDAIVDIVGAASGFAHLGVQRFFSGPFRVGTGFTGSAHGRIPLPAPATALLIQGCPVEHTRVPHELTTPTGAAVVSELVEKEDFNYSAPLVFTATGYGKGSRDLDDRPNLLRLMLGQLENSACPGCVVLESNIDDMNPQCYDHLMDLLFDNGAYDVFFVPVQMKKNRPGVLLQVITDHRHLENLARLILTESTSIGVRFREAGRLVLERKTETVKTPLGRFRVKSVVLPDGTVRARPEYDDLRRAARKTGRPLVEIMARLEAYLNQPPG